jgi:hypothetical protein
MSSTLSHQVKEDSEAHAPATDDIETDVLVCQRCGGHDVARSRRRTWERPLGWLGVLPYRCLCCWQRFYH